MDYHNIFTMEQNPQKQTFFVHKNASFYYEEFFMNNKFVFPWDWPAAATEMERIAKTALKFKEHLLNLHRLG